LRFTHLLRPGGLPASPPSLRSVASRRQRGSAKHWRSGTRVDRQSSATRTTISTMTVHT